MKLTAIILLVGFLHVSARTTAQERISISLKSVSLEKVFSEIEKRSGFSIFYNTDILKYSGLISVDMKDATIDEVMAKCLKGLPLAFSIQDKTIFIRHDNQKKVSDLLNDPGDKDPAEVTTVVHGENGAPLAGASIYIKKLKKAGQTNAEGEFVLKNVPDGEYDVEISFIGFERQSTTMKVVNHRARITVDMKQASNSIDAPVVIPYGTTTQRLNTGDVTTVTAKEIEQQPVSNPLAALEGRVPGLYITQATGAPGGAFTVQLRGINSITNNTNPFYVIDGVPYNSEISGNNATVPLINGILQNGSPLNYIDPYDIESIEVLKDADATAIYGSRAANGAILISTKKGKAGRMQVDLNVNSGVQNPARDIKLLNTQQYLAVRHEAFNNDAASPNPNSDFDLTFWDTTRYSNWSKILTNQTAHYNNFQGSVSGGNTSSQYLFGAGYNAISTPFPTLLPGDGLDEKASVHFSLTTQSTDKRFRLSFTGSYVADKNTVQSEDFSTDRLNLAPDAPVLFNPDGSLNWDPLVSGQAGTWTNPYSNLHIKYKQNTSNLVGNAVLSYLLLPNWEIKTSFGYTLTTINEVQAIPTTYFDPGLDIPSGQSEFNANSSNSWIIEPQTNYKLQFSRGVITLLLGSTFEENNSSSQNTSASNFVSDALIEDPSAAGSISVSSGSSQYKYDAAFGRLGYNWEDKYLLNLSARRDGSSRFGPGKQFGDFGAIGGGWIFSKENFIQKSIPFLSFGKLRASYGTTGNDGIADYQYFNLYSPTYVPYGGEPGLTPVNLSNPNLAWELTKKLEGGIELGILKDRIGISANFYRNRSGNQLVSTPVSQVTGFSSIAANLAALVQNTGKEFVIRAVNIKSRDFTWSSSLNLTINQNKLVSFPNLATSVYANTLKIGQPLNVKLLYHMQEINDTTGVYQFTTNKGAVTYSPNYNTDRTASVNTMPKFFGGLQNSIRYKGWSMDFLLQFVKQTGENFVGAYYQMPGTMYNIPVAFLNRWQQPGDKAKYQEFSQNYAGAAFHAFRYVQQSDFAYSDASFIRLKNLAISWQFSKPTCQQLHLQNCRVYLQGQNLLTFTHYNGIDPETQGIGLPPMRVFTAGVQVGL